MQSTQQLQAWLLNQAKAHGIARASTKVINPNRVRLIMSTPDVKSYLEISRYMPNPMHVVYSLDANMEDQDNAKLGVGHFARFDVYKNLASKNHDSRQSFLEDIKEVRKALIGFGDEQYKAVRNQETPDEKALERTKRIRASAISLADLTTAIARAVTFSTET